VESMTFFDGRSYLPAIVLLDTGLSPCSRCLNHSDLETYQGIVLACRASIEEERVVEQA
jgi:hypothetical protein